MYLRYQPGGNALDVYLAEGSARYSPEVQMVGTTWSSPGYHTQVPDGHWVHPTRDNLEYALALLRAPLESAATYGGAERASAIIRRVLALQDTDPTRATYGIWPWLLEESLDEMAPPDWNWADFNGALLAQMLAEHADRLPDDLIAEMRASLGHAGWAIFRRNVGPDYTNIAVLGGVTTAAAGELLDEPRLLDYARRRLQRVIAHTEYHGGFNEYNSPTYTLVVMQACELGLQLLHDAAARAAVDTLRRMAWQVMAEHYHPATGEWAGPHSRSYRDRLDATTRRVLLRGAGLEEDDVSLMHLIDMLPCPSDLVSRFEALPATDVEIVRAFNRHPEPWAGRTGTTWLSEGAALGTVDYENLWTQRRPLIGYWQMPGDASAAVLRARCLHDGRDFASAAIHNVQRRSRVLSGFALLTNRGDWHHHLDHPEDDIFTIADLRVRYELDAEGACVTQLAPDRFELSAGEYRAVVHTLPGTFDGASVVWEAAEVDGKALVDAVCYHGPARGFNFAEIAGMQLAAGLELLMHDTPALDEGPAWQPVSDTTADVAWPAADLALMLPVRAHASR